MLVSFHVGRGLRWRRYALIGCDVEGCEVCTLDVWSTVCCGVCEGAIVEGRKAVCDIAGLMNISEDRFLGSRLVRLLFWRFEGSCKAKNVKNIRNCCPPELETWVDVTSLR